MSAEGAGALEVTRLGCLALEGVMRSSVIRVALTAALLLVPSTVVHAATFTVDTTTDDPALTSCDDATPNDCSLRGAITAANALAEAGTVIVPSGTYELTQIGTC